MKPENLIDAIGGIDPVYVEEAETWKKIEAVEETESWKRSESEEKTELWKSSETVERAETADMGKEPRKSAWNSRKNSRRLRTFLPIAACFGLVIAGSAFALSQFEKSGMTGGIGGGNESAGIMESAQEEEAGMAASAEGALSGAGADATGAEGAEEELAAGTDGAVLPDGEAGNLAESDTYIVINEIKNWSETSYSIERVDYHEEYALEELSDYYGVKVVPDTIPKDLLLEKNENPYMVSYLNSGKVVCDKNRIVYWNAERNRKLVIRVNKVESDLIITYGGKEQQKSLIHGTEVLIGYASDEAVECYMAEFKNGDVTFTVQAANLSEDELIDILESLLEKEP